MRGVSYEESVEYLVEKYGDRFVYKTDDNINIPKVSIKEKKKVTLDESVLTKATSGYLLSRGISEKTQEQYCLGYNKENKGYTAIGWTSHKDNTVQAIKYRSTRGKDMFYEPGGRGINTLVFGLFHVKHFDSVVICEGEIDALSFIEVGIPAIAVGTASISRRQVDLIKYCGFKTIYLGGDNDEAGKKFNKQMESAFIRYMDVLQIDYGRHKDSNDFLKRGDEEELRQLCDRAKPVYKKLI